MLKTKIENNEIDVDVFRQDVDEAVRLLLEIDGAKSSIKAFADKWKEEADIPTKEFKAVVQEVYDATAATQVAFYSEIEDVVESIQVE